MIDLVEKRVSVPKQIKCESGRESERFFLQMIGEGERGERKEERKRERELRRREQNVCLY
jgi:hypothetical protein